MTRKAIRHRPTEDEAHQILEDYADAASPSVLALAENREALRDKQRARADHLLTYRPKSRHPAASDVVGKVADLVLRVDYWSYESDKIMMMYGVRYGLYCVEAHGDFIPARHLAPTFVKQWTSTANMKVHERQTIASTLKRLRTGKRAVYANERAPVTPPYSRNEWAKWERLCFSGASAEATAIITLAGHLGLRPNEITRTAGYWIRRDEHGMSVAVPDKNGVIRIVPAFGFAARWLETQIDAGDRYLIRPNRTKRSAVISEVKKSVARHTPTFASFSIDRARHAYIGHLLTHPVPLTDVFEVAGLTSGSSLPSSLISFYETSTDDSVRLNLSQALGRRR